MENYKLYDYLINIRKTYEEENVTSNLIANMLIKTFQRENNIPTTGIFDDATNALLDKYLEEKEKRIEFIKNKFKLFRNKSKQDNSESKEV